MKLINIGFGNLVSEERLVAVISPDSAPVKRMIQETRERGLLITAGSDDHGAFGKGVRFYMGAVSVDEKELVLGDLLQE